MPLRLIGMALRDEAADHLQHVGNVLGGSGFHSGRQDVQGSKIVVEVFRGPFCQMGDVFIILPCPLDDLVVNVGNVANVGNLWVERLEQPDKHVCAQHGAQIAEMDPVIHGWPAEIEADIAGIIGGEGNSGALMAVVKPQAGPGGDGGCIALLRAHVCSMRQRCVWCNRGIYF